MKATAIVQMSNGGGPGVAETMGTGLADVGYMRKPGPLNDTTTSILSPSFLSHRDGWLVQLGALGILLCHLL